MAEPTSAQIWARLFRGVDEHQNKAWLEFWSRLPDEPRVLWYPSAGNDFRDLMEAHPIRRELHGIRTEPEVYLHTDYEFGDEYDFRNNLEDGAILHQDTRTTIRRLSRLRLVAKGWHPDYYRLDPRLVPYGTTRKQAEAELWQVEVESKVVGRFQRPVLYVAAENFNFLRCVLLAYDLGVSHLVKVRDGTGLGGGLVCMTVLYPSLGALGTEYLFADSSWNGRDLVDQIWRDIPDMNDFYWKLISRLTPDRSPPKTGPKTIASLPGWILRPGPQISSWSGYRVDVLTVFPDTKPPSASLLEGPQASWNAYAARLGLPPDQAPAPGPEPEPARRRRLNPWGSARIGWAR